MKRLLRGLVCLNLIYLSACAGLQPAEPNQDWARHSQQLMQLQAWQVDGKIALRTPEQAESATLHWQQQETSTHIRLSGPVGFNLTTLDSDGSVLEIRQGDDVSRWQLDDPATYRDAPWQLPFNALHYWLKGVPAPQLATDAIAMDASGQLPASISQQGWTVDYTDFAQFGPYLLPTRLRLQNKDTSARIVIRRWSGFASQ